MKKVLMVLTLAIVVFVYLNRERLFLRDPLAKVERGGVAVSGAAVLINYSNDILLDDTSSGRNRMYVVQNWNLAPSVPGELKCFALFVCLADADHVAGAPIHAGAPAAVMTNKRVEFVDENDANVVVTLR